MSDLFTLEPTPPLDAVTMSALVDMVEQSTRARWGHGFDRVDRAAVALVLADRELARHAGTTAEREDRAYRYQCVAFREWWDACGGSTVDACHVRDVSYGWAVGEVRAATRSPLCHVQDHTAGMAEQ